MTAHYPHLAARLFNTPLLIHPGKLSAIVAGLAGRFDLTPAPSAYAPPGGTAEKGGYRRLDTGVAVLEIFGALAHRTTLKANSTYVQGYDSIASSFETAMADPFVRALLLEIDSPGGEVAGAFQLAEQIHAARGRKPIIAIASDCACSAAYLIASAADSISITRTGVVGSIGVATCHADLSRALDKEGVAVTCIYAGAHKVDGNPYQPLPPDVAAQIQADVDHYYALFLNAVAAYRPTTDALTLRATEARTFIGPQALDARLADRLETPDQAIARLAASLSLTQKRALVAQTTRKSLMSAEAETPDVPVPDPAPDPAHAPLDAVSIARLSQGEPRLTPLLLATPHTEEQVKARLANAVLIRQICAHARQPELADHLIAENADESTAKAACWEVLVARAEASPVDNTPPAAIPAHLPTEARCEAEWNRDPALRAEFGALAIYQAYARAQASGRVKTYGGNT